MSKYKVGDKVLLEAEVLAVNSDNNVIFPYYLGLKNNASYHCAEKDIECISKTYEDGLNDAWELARKICGDTDNEGNYDGKTISEIFGSYLHVGDIIDDFTYQQALAKIEAYEESKAIKVGDVVRFKDSKTEVLITSVKEELNGIHIQTDEYGKIGDVHSCICRKDVEKTDKHFDIEHLLEQIRGNE